MFVLLNKYLTLVSADMGDGLEGHTGLSKNVYFRFTAWSFKTISLFVGKFTDASLVDSH